MGVVNRRGRERQKMRERMVVEEEGTGMTAPPGGVEFSEGNNRIRFVREW
jgi:hypothetical protein